MNNLVPTRINPDYYYNSKKIGDNIIFEKDNEDNIDNQQKTLQTKQKFIVLSSLDRDWYSNSIINPFNYSVKLGNDRTTNDLATENDIKNIVGIQVTKLILPNKKITIDYSNNKSTISYDPFIIVNLNQNNTTNEGTSEIINKASGIMIPLTPISKLVSDISYLEYKNINGAIKKYYNNPISNISQLEIEIKTQLNKNPIDINDVLGISTIYSTGTNLTEQLNIKTSTLFNDQYNIGDMIKIEGYIYRDTSIHTTESTLFNNYINREKGHKIVDIKNSNFSYFTITQTGTTITQSYSGDTYYNDAAFVNGDINKLIVYEDGTIGKVASRTSGTVIESNITKTITSPQRIYLKLAAGTQVSQYAETIIISIPHSISTSDGTIIEDSLWTNLKSKSDTEDDNTASGDSGGKLINTNLQSYIFINVDYLDYENSVSSQLI
jgi:hypothetical protein